MKAAKLIAVLGVLSMTAVLVYGFTIGDFSRDGGELLRNPWGVVSLVDLYVGFTLFSLWIIYREESLARSIFWVVLMLTLGFFTGALYTLLALWKSEGSWERFWLGSRYSDPQ